MPDPSDPAPADETTMTDRELDVEIAERLMGYRWYALEGLPPLLCLPEDKMPDRIPCERPVTANPRLSTHKVPKYSTDIAAVWMVVERLREHWGNLDLTAGLSWHCKPGWLDGPHKPGDPWGTADTAPRAICLAALQTFAPEKTHDARL
jgi:hypothetical protein